MKFTSMPEPPPNFIENRAEAELVRIMPRRKKGWMKSNEFLVEHAGKLNLYLSALDEYVKNPDENPLIGIILCRDKDEKTVQFAFRGITTPMGVAKYKTADELPEKLRNALPNPDDLKKLL